MRRSISITWRATQIACALAGIGAGFPVCAQQAPSTPIAGLLSGLPGATVVQEEAGRVTEIICPNLPAPDALGTGTERLSDTCTRLVVSADRKSVV